MESPVRVLHEVAIDIEACETPEQVYELVVGAAEDILEFDIAIADAEEDGVLVPRAMASGMDEDAYYHRTPIDDEDNFGARAYRNGESYLIDDLRASDAAPADSAYRSALTVPVGDHGVFQAADRDVGVFDEDDLELTELLVTHAQETLTRLERERELRRNVAELERQNERLDRFAGIVSHDLRNPLNVATGRLDIAREECDSEHLDEVARALDRMDRLIDNTLTLARQGRTVGDTEPVDLAAVAERCWRSVGASDATLEVVDDLSLDADPERFRFLLENLLRNAVEHAGPDVAIEVGALDGRGFYVADDGPGISPDEREAVFDPGHTDAEGGTGFGLAIVEEIAEAHDWKVAATESSAGGARFEVRVG